MEHTRRIHEFLEKKGISPNIASFVGTGAVRMYVIGEDNVAPTPAQLDSMKLLIRQAMEEGALGVTNALIYPVDFFAKTDELIALSKEAAKYGGMYTSHMRSEGNKLLEAVEELITISKEAGIPAEIFHLKAGGKNNWSKMDSVIRTGGKSKKRRTGYYCRHVYLCCRSNRNDICISSDLAGWWLWKTERKINGSEDPERNGEGNEYGCY